MGVPGGGKKIGYSNYPHPNPLPLPVDVASSDPADSRAPRANIDTRAWGKGRSGGNERAEGAPIYVKSLRICIIF